MTYAAIMRWDDSNRVTMYMPFGAEAEALAHVAAHAEQYPQAFVVQAPQGDAAAWTLDPVAKTATYSAPPEPVPQETTPAKARIVLLNADKLELVQSAVDAHPDPAVKIYWEYAQTFERNHPYIVALGTALGLDLDDLFRQAARIV